MHLRLLLDFNMRLCVTLVYPGVPLQSRMKICRNNIIVYTPCKYIDRAVEVSIVNEYSDVALRIVSIVNDSTEALLKQVTHLLFAYILFY